jgi:hypothetical protein
MPPTARPPPRLGAALTMAPLPVQEATEGWRALKIRRAAPFGDVMRDVGLVVVILGLLAFIVVGPMVLPELDAGAAGANIGSPGRR